MKKLIIKISIIACLMLIPALMNQISAQSPPSPPSNQGNSGDATAANSGAPLDGGLSILLLIGAAYGGKKIQTLRKK